MAEGQKKEEIFAMNAWESIFVQSPVNEGRYDEDELPYLNWDWPKETWFQTRLNQLRKHQFAASLKTSMQMGPKAEVHVVCSQTLSQRLPAASSRNHLTLAH